MTANAPIRILVADDQELVRRGFCALIAAEDDLEVVGEAATGVEAVDQAFSTRPDVILMDIRMPELDGIEATTLIAGPEVDEPLKVVIITTFDLDEYVYGAIGAGATGFLLKNSGPELLVEAVRAAALDESLISPAVTTRLLRNLGRQRTEALSRQDDRVLSDREEQVLRAVAVGATNTEIATDLHLSVSTVKAHVASLLVKIEARNRVELALWAYRTGRVEDEPNRP